jgi:glycosyltransferase involved in cell wall biosynthesis
MPQHIFVAGFPSSIGGANTELWHTLKLWRSHGLEVTCIQLWDEPDPEWLDRVSGIGVKSVFGRPEDLHSPGNPHELRGSIVVSFCNSHFMNWVRAFDRLNCKVVWVNCMTWLFPAEQVWTRTCGQFDGYVFQSDYQQAQLAPQIENIVKMGTHGFYPDRFRRIPGAFDCTEFPVRTRERLAGGPFVIGRLSRSTGLPSGEAAVEKYPRDLWRQYEAIKQFVPELQARVMGWCSGIEDRCGTPPDWAECLPDGAETSQDFLASLHCMVPGIGCTAENWPRVGLEAMATGVPMVVEEKGGWPEMALPGCVKVDRREQVTQVAGLAQYEDLRQEHIEEGRRRVEELTDGDRIFAGWENLFEEVER